MGRVLSAKRAVRRARRISIGIAVTVGALGTGIAFAPTSGAVSNACASVQGATVNRRNASSKGEPDSDEPAM